MENDDEFGFKSLAQSFAPEVKAERKAEVLAKPPIPQATPQAPVARTVAPPPLPEVKPEEVAANIPQQATPVAPAIQNPIFDPEFQKAAGLTMVAPVLAGLGALGAGAYGYYKGRKSVKDRMMGEGLKAPEGAFDMSRLDPEWQKILAQSERNRQVKQAEAMKNIEPIVQPETNVVAPKNTPSAVQGALQPENSVKSVPSINNAQLQYGNQNKIASMMANQEMRNPLGGLASAYTQPIGGAQIPDEIPTIGQLTDQVVGKSSVAPPQTVAEVAAKVAPTTEAKSSETKAKAKGRPTKEAQAKAMEGLTFRSDLGPGDNWLFNSFGGEGRKAILAQYNEGKPAGSYENAQQIFKKMQEERFGPGRSELPRDIAKERGVVPPETNYGKLGKTAKMAGIAGLALTASQLAQAKNATQARQTIGEALLPFLATPSNLAEGTLPPEIVNAMMAERQKLGSPYRSVPPQ